MTDMTLTPSVIEMSSAQVTVGGTDIGTVIGGITFTYTVGTQKIFGDQSSMPLTHFIIQEEAQLVVNMAEYSYDNLQLIIPWGTYVLDSGETKKKIGVGGAQIASSDYAEIIVNPVTGGSGTIDTDTNLRITIFKAIPVSNFEAGFTKDGVRVISVTYDAIRDSTQSAGVQLFLLGDSTATA